MIKTIKKVKKGKGEFSGSVQIRKNYVSLYLVGIYGYPELAKNISAGLKKGNRENHVLTLRMKTRNYLTNWLV